MNIYVCMYMNVFMYICMYVSTYVCRPKYVYCFMYVYESFLCVCRHIYVYILPVRSLSYCAFT